MAQTAHLGREHLCRVARCLAGLSCLHAHGNWKDRATDCARRAENGVCPRYGSQLEGDREASTAALAYQFIENIKKNPELGVFQFDMAAPRILPNDHAQFRVEGRPR